MGKARLCVWCSKSQGLNLNANPGPSFAGKISHWLKGGMWFDFTFYNKKTFPAANTCLLACLDQQNFLFSAGFLCPWLNIYKGFSCPLAKGFLCPWLNISVGTSFFVCLYPQSSLATGPQLFLTLN